MRQSSYQLLELEPPSRLEQRFPQSAQLMDARPDIIEPKILGVDSARDFVPGDRRRNCRARFWPNRIHRCERAPPGILVVVHQHASFWALGHAVFSGD